MAKQQSCQKFIFKLHSARLRKAKWDLVLPMAEARRNEEVISLGDSQMFRFIDEINGLENVENAVKSIQNTIYRLKKEPNSLQNRKSVKKLYARLDELQFKRDIIHLVIDSEKDYRRACKGFMVNGIKYRRLLGTNGGIKCSTIVFINEQLYPEIKSRIDNGRNMEMKFVPAKLEAYQALVCSGSTAVSMPKGIAIIQDCFTKFKSDVINISDEADGEPVMTFERDAEVELKESDGYGMILPSLAQRWSEELGLDYTVCGVNTRFAWEKGMLFCFDFLEFADRVAGTRIIKDAWGNDVDLSNVELIFTTSMVKLWDSYDSCEHYLSCCAKNKYTIGIAKTSPKTLERERNLNYQFIQSYHLTEDQVEDLITPTIEEIHEILLLDYRKTILFLKGYGLNEENIDSVSSDFAKAIMIDKRILNDPFIRKKIFYLIKQRIQDAKIGVIKVHGNFSIVSGDPYSLCQNMFGLEVTGLLKSGEIYNAYWNEVGAEKLACFRAPMTVMSNIRGVRPCSTAEVLHWYQYMNTCTIFNSWDTAAQALNGLDKILSPASVMAQ